MLDPIRPGTKRSPVTAAHPGGDLQAPTAAQPGSGRPPAAGRRWAVDAMNVIGSRPDGWWRDRPAAMRALAEKLESLSACTGDEVTVVFDGRPVDLGHVPAGLHVVFGSSADDAIVELVGGDAEPGSLTVVTSDRKLVARVRARGAVVEGVRAFRRRLDRLAEPAGS